MKERRASGSFISLSVALTMTLVLIGGALFLLARILGGSRELNNASDAGVLNSARAALTHPSIRIYPTPAAGLPILTKDFFALADQPGSDANDISLLTYNRVVAQAVLVATNAQVENTQDALRHANEVIQAAKAVGRSLQTSFATQATTSFLDHAFLNVANQNNLKMMGGQPPVSVNPTNRAELKTAFMNAGASANVWFDPNVISVAQPGLDPIASYGIPINSNGQIKPRRAANGDYISAFYESPAGYNATYVRGYSPIRLLQGTPFADTLFAVPNLPQQNPHLVDLNRFEQSLRAPDPFVPQNAVRVDCQAFDRTARSSVKTVSCAIVGCTNSTFVTPNNSGVARTTNDPTNGTDYVAAIPAGFIRIVNLVDMNTNINNNGLGLPVVRNVLYNGLHYIFNTRSGNNLASDGGGGAFLSRSGFFVTTRDGGRAILQMWAAYVNSVGGDALGHNPNLDPYHIANQGHTPTLFQQNPQMPVFPIHRGSGSDQLATLQEILFNPGLRQSNGFLLNSATVNNAPQWVLNMLPDLLGNFGSDIETAVGANNYPTAVEYLKELVEKKLYEAADQRSFRFTFNITPQLCANAPTGLKLFKHFRRNGQPISHASPNWWNGAPTPSPTFPQFGNKSGADLPTPLELLNEINATKNRTNAPDPNDPEYVQFIELLTQRCRQMSPRITSRDVTNALNSATLGMSNTPQTLYLHLDLRSPTPRLVLTPTLVDNHGNHYDTGVGPDIWEPANPNRQYPTFKAQYSLKNTIVDTKIDGSPTALRGDMNLEDQPFQRTTTTNRLDGVDGAVFYQSSGYNNLLGEVHFFQTLTPTRVTWSMPN